MDFYTSLRNRNSRRSTITTGGNAVFVLLQLLQPFTVLQYAQGKNKCYDIWDTEGAARAIQILEVCTGM